MAYYTMDDIDAIRERVDALFPANDQGFGYDFRMALRLAETHSMRLTSNYADCVLRLVDELLGRMESAALAEAEEDAYWSSVYASEVGA